MAIRWNLLKLLQNFLNLGLLQFSILWYHKENGGLDVIVSEKQTGAKFCRVAGFYGSTIDARYYTKKEILEKAKNEVATMFVKYGTQKIESVILKAIEKQKKSS